MSHFPAGLVLGKLDFGNLQSLGYTLDSKCTRPRAAWEALVPGLIPLNFLGSTKLSRVLSLRDYK